MDTKYTMTLGTICRLQNSSTESLLIYETLKKKLPFLVCPCSWKNRIVVIQDLLSSKHCIISLKGFEKQMSVCALADLKQLH